MPESSDPEGLYEGGADFYDLFFGEEDPEETAFFTALLADAPSKRILSLGCGTGRLESALFNAGFHVTGIDTSEAMLGRARQRDPRGHYIASPMENMPDALPGEPFGAVISSTLSFAYIHDTKTARGSIAECARRMMPGAFLVLDLPIAQEPRRIQGTIETLETSPGHHYRFMWHDVITEDETRAVLDTDIWITGPQRTAARRAQLAIYRPEGIRNLLEDSGEFTNTLFHAAHDISSATVAPPPDCRRAVVVARRAG